MNTNFFKGTFKFSFFLIIFQLAAFIGEAALSCAKPDYEALTTPTTLPRTGAWERMTPKSRADWAENRTADLFERAGFFICPSKHPVGEQGADGLFIRINPVTNKITIVVNETKYRKDRLSLDLGDMACAKCDGGAEHCNQMSWKWIQNAIQWIETHSPGHCGDDATRRKCEAICPWLKDHILTGRNIFSVIRTANVMDQDGNCRFYALGEDAAQIAAAKRVLTSVLKA